MAERTPSCPPESGPPSGEPTLEIVERLAADQQARWRRGDKVLLEAYLALHPSLAANAEVILELILNEVQLREQQGQTVTPEEYARRFPHLAEQIHLQFEVDSALRRLVPDSGAGTSVNDQPTLVAGVAAGPAAGDGGYELGEVLGRGGMGIVYKAYQVELKRTVALKMIRDSALTAPGAVERFRREAEAVARFQHPNIVQIYQVGQRDGVPYCAFEYVDGCTLAQRLAASPLPPRAAAQLLRTLAQAIEYAHARGIVHRDLKPANVLLAKGPEIAKGRETRVESQSGLALDSRLSSLDSPLDSRLSSLDFPKITDFGLAKRLDAELGSETEMGAILGTPNYMAPEQAAGQVDAIGPASDVYALGAILYEMLTGRPPFKGNSVLDTLQQVRELEPLAPSWLQPKLPRDLETICLKCLQKAPARRYESAAALAEDLRRFLDGEPIQARPVGVLERAGKWARRHKALAGLLVASLVAAVSSAAVYVLWSEARLQSIEHARRLAEGRSEVQELLHEAERALEQRQWSEAGDAAGKARVLAGKLALDDLSAAAEQILNTVAGRRAVRARLADFQLSRDAALLHLCEVTGLGHGRYVALIRTAARAALDAAPGLDSVHLSDEEKRAVLATRYGLTLLLADQVAEVLPGEQQEVQATRALQILDEAGNLHEPTADFHERRARYLDLAGHAAAARQEQATARDLPRHAVGAIDGFSMGMHRYREHDWRGAAQHFERAWQADPAQFWPRFLSAICYFRQGQPAEARACLETCRALRHDFIWVPLLLGFAHGESAVGRGVLEAQRSFVLAEESFRAAAALPSDADADYVLRTNRGLLRYRRAQAEGRLAPAHLGCLLAVPGVYIARVGELEQRHRAALRAARADFEAAIALRPGNYQAQVNLSFCLLALQDLEGAHRALNEAIAVEAHDPDLYRHRARLRKQSLHWPEALADVQRAIDEERRREPVDALVRAADFRELGELQLQCGNPRLAAEAFHSALAHYEAAAEQRGLGGSLALELARVHRLHARAHQDLLSQAAPARQRAHAQMALASLERCLTLAATALPRAEAAEAYRVRALLHARLKQHDQAYADLGRALHLRPEAATYALRGWLLLEWAGAPKLAVRDFEQAQRLDARDADAVSGQGLACVLLGQSQEAISAAEKSLRLGPASPRHLLNVARIYAQLYARALTAQAGSQVAALRRAQFEEQALALVRQALVFCPASERPVLQEALAGDRALEPLRSLAAYQRLIEEYR